jgi:hypothetical protein
MRTSLSIFSTGGPAPWRSGDLQLAWLDAADDAHEAYLAWRDSDRAEHAGAFTVYHAALDREEAAARALELQSRAFSGWLRSG